MSRFAPSERHVDKLTVVVENSDLELISFKVVFADRTEYDPRTSHYFREGNIGRGKAKVQVWAK